ncbi:MAG TPA: hypothetical protein VLE96_07540 [Chlamydiales bacterium]|nr:hypothetical protein [Chlamydiales bacterium]
MLLGDFSIKKKTFALKPVIKKLKTLGDVSEGKKREKVNRTLFELIDKEETPCFLLSAVLDFIEQIEKEGILESYNVSSFELWLNQSHMSAEHNLRIRGKIVGKLVDRSDYQVFFPIGMGKIYEGTHFVTAHKSPDLDTTIASFWGWVDAFGARVGNALHVWNLPGGPPSSQIEIQWIFEDLFGKGIFTHLPKTRSALSLTGKDLMTQSGMVLKKLEDTISGSDHEREHNSIVVVDEEGFFLGDWRSFDVEEVRQVIILLSSCLRWFENQLHLHLISLFAKKDLEFSEIEKSTVRLFSMPILECEPSKEFSNKQRKEVGKFISKVLGIENGLLVTFEKLGDHLSRLAKVPFMERDTFYKKLKSLFDKKGKLIENRPDIFSFLEDVVRNLHETIVETRARLEQLDIAMKTKSEVFGHHPTFVTMDSDVDEIRQKMGAHVSLTVAHPTDGKMLPAGVIQAATLRKTILGTVSLRDFCNREEMGIPAYLDVISVIDHHKSQLHTFAPPFAVISDAQSSNTLVARQAFELNDQYSMRGQNAASIVQQIKSICQNDARSNRIMQRLLKKQNLANQKTDFFISVEREYTEYLHFLYGILDDTDLLSKVSVLDVECVVSLLNRLKSLMTGKEEEIISLDDLPKDKNFPKIAAMRILQNKEMYSLYNKVYAHREKEVAENILLCQKGKPNQIFADTKVQNGCCRVGQTKIFARNVPLFSKAASDISLIWLENSIRINKEQPQIDLFIHMISTVASADEVCSGKATEYLHKDEMWIWIPDQELAIEHLKRFLNGFQLSPGLKNNPLEIELIGPKAQEYHTYFKTSFIEVPMKQMKGKQSLIIIRYKAGSLNSRKAMISPFLPTL